MVNVPVLLAIRIYVTSRPLGRSLPVHRTLAKAADAGTEQHIKIRQIKQPSLLLGLTRSLIGTAP